MSMDNPSWLASLPSHPIFRASSSARQSVTRSWSFAASESEGQQLPPSPDVSSIHDFLEAEHDGDIEADSTALDATATGGDNAARKSKKKRPKKERRRRVGCIARRTELVVAVGSQLRILSLANFKTRAETSNNGKMATSSPGYKVREDNNYPYLSFIMN